MPAENPPAIVRHYRRAGLDEAAVWNDVCHTMVAGTAKNVSDILHYAVTEMVNNSIDHSSARTVELRAGSDAMSTWFEVGDDGVGIFRHLVDAHRALDEPNAALALGKGKLTTQPERHSGEGIFFTSKVADLFRIDSAKWRWTVDNLRDDESIASTEAIRGTRVHFSILKRSRRKLAKVFASFSPDLVFSKTRIRVRLYERGVEFVSRSEAKRLLLDLDRFAHVTLDFARVRGVGQGFVDEAFRVWALQHPSTALEPVNMSPAVRFMVERILRSR